MERTEITDNVFPVTLAALKHPTSLLIHPPFLAVLLRGWAAAFARRAMSRSIHETWPRATYGTIDSPGVSHPAGSDPAEHDFHARRSYRYFFSPQPASPFCGCVSDMLSADPAPGRRSRRSRLASAGSSQCGGRMPIWHQQFSMGPLKPVDVIDGQSAIVPNRG